MWLRQACAHVQSCDAGRLGPPRVELLSSARNGRSIACAGGLRALRPGLTRVTCRLASTTRRADVGSREAPVRGPNSELNGTLRMEAEAAYLKQQELVLSSRFKNSIGNFATRSAAIDHRLRHTSMLYLRYGFGLITKSTNRLPRWRYRSSRCDDRSARQSVGASPFFQARLERLPVRPVIEDPGTCEPQAPARPWSVSDLPDESFVPPSSRTARRYNSEP